MHDIRQVVERLRNNGVIKDDTPQVNALLKREVRLCTCVCMKLYVDIQTCEHTYTHTRSWPFDCRNTRITCYHEFCVCFKHETGAEMDSLRIVQLGDGKKSSDVFRKLELAAKKNLGCDYLSYARSIVLRGRLRRMYSAVSKGTGIKMDPLQQAQQVRGMRCNACLDACGMLAVWRRMLLRRCECIDMNLPAAFVLYVCILCGYKNALI
jgi:hypothetical protein